MSPCAKSATMLAEAPARGIVTVEPFEALDRYYNDKASALNWDCVFVLPPWIRAWWPLFGKHRESYMAVVRHQDRVTGIAPLMVSGDTVRLVGCSDLTDYGDFIIAPGQGPRFFRTLLEHLRSEGFRRLDTGRMRADAPTIGELEAQACRAGMDVCCERADVLYEMALPATWDDYLSFLSGKERHEVRRKLRRLHRAGEISLRVVEDRNDVPDAIASFMELFRMNTPEKVRFMTARKETFFRRLAGEMARAGLLKLFFLDLEGSAVAATMCFDHRSTVYLYNNGYDSRFSDLSVGLLCKIDSIRESISLGRKSFNFLRGAEPYKQRLGGSPLELLRCHVILN